MSHFKTLIAGLALAIVLPGLASAETISVRDNPNTGPSVWLASNLHRSVSIQVGGVNRSVQAGVFSLQHSADSGWVDFLTFCLQLDEYPTLPKDHTLVDGATYFPSAADRTALGVLYGNFLTSGTGLQNANTSAALQAIVWEIVEDGASAFDLSSGSFKLFTADVLTAANGLWSMIISGDYSAVKLDVLAADGTQNLLIPSVPLPGALSLLLSGIAGLGFAARMRKPVRA